MEFKSVIPNLRDDESVYAFVRPHFLSFLPWIGIGVGLVIMGIAIVIVTYLNIPEVQFNPMARNILVVMASAYFLLMLPFLAVAFIDYYYDLHIVSDRRLIDIDQHSLFVRELNELALEEVQDVTSRHAGILSSVFDFGTVTIETSGSRPKFEFDNVYRPREIASIILDLSDQAKQRIGQGSTVKVTPQGPIKGIINNVCYTSTEPMIKLGAVYPGDVQELTQDSKEQPQAAHTVKIAGIPAERDVYETPLNRPTQPVEVVNKEPIPTTPESETDSDMPENKELQSPQKQEPIPQAPKEDSSDELDIVIDDPSRPPRS